MSGPVLANLFIHYAFDMWLAREFPTVEFERYADDAVVHCVTERQAREVLAALEVRMEQVGLRLHPDKTRIVYCQDEKRRQRCETTWLTFLWYMFRLRSTMGGDRQLFVAFTPALSPQALTRMGQQVRRWRIHLWIARTLAELSGQINPIVAGCIQYYGRFDRSCLYPLLRRIDTYLMRWAAGKYKRLRSYKRFNWWWLGILDRNAELFAHWDLGSLIRWTAMRRAE